MTLEYCDFIVYTQNHMNVERIIRDSAFFEKILPLLREFYFRYLLPEITSPSKYLGETFYAFSESFYKETIVKDLDF